MENKYLTIKELAAAANVSVQSIYKRLKRENDEIHNYTWKKDGTTLIAAAALQFIYGTEQPLRHKPKEKASAEQSIVELLKQQLEMIQKELDEKNKTIAELLEQLKECSSRETQYQQLLDHQQQLTAMEKQKILALEDAAFKKRGLFGLFGKKKSKYSQEVEENEQ